MRCERTLQEGRFKQGQQKGGMIGAARGKAEGEAIGEAREKAEGERIGAAKAFDAALQKLISSGKTGPQARSILE